MKRYFVCLANSFKHGGRCLAGVEIELFNNGRYSIIRNADGSPKWLRPISKKPTKELSASITSGIKLLDIVEIDGVVDCPDYAHSENVYYSWLKRTNYNFDKIQGDINDLCTNTNIRPLLFFNRGKAVPTEIFQTEKYSLIFIRGFNCIFRDTNDERKYRVCFEYNKYTYDLPITDPDFINYINSKGLEHINKLDNYYFTISLGEEFNDFHYKLIAGIVKLN